MDWWYWCIVLSLRNSGYQVFAVEFCFAINFLFCKKKFFSKNFLTCVKCLTRTNCAEEKSLKLYQQKSRWRHLNNGLKFFYSRDSRNIFLALFVLFAHQSQKLHVSWSSPLWKKHTSIQVTLSHRFPETHF